MAKTVHEAPPKGLSTLSRLRHAVAGAHLSDILAGLRSDDLAARVAAAEQLHFVTGRQRAGALDVALAALSDPVPAVRYHAIRALVQAPDGRGRLIPLLVSPLESDAALKLSVLSDITHLADPGSPFEGKAAKAVGFTAYVPDGANYQGHIVREALRAATSVATALPILETARAIDLVIAVYAPWDRSIDLRNPSSGYRLHIGTWPDRCCVCGAGHPGGSAELPFSGGIESLVSGTEVRTRSADGTLRVPVCQHGRCQPQPPTVGGHGLSIRFDDLRFVAELLELGAWRVFPPPPPST